MHAKYVFLLLAAAIIVSSTFGLKSALAADTPLAVRPGDATCAQPSCFTTIHDALIYANSIISNPSTSLTTFSILVGAGTYNEAITLGTGITSLGGIETARTFLGSGITVSGGTPQISNFYFRNAPTGIAIINNSASATIRNNIFVQNGTAIQITQSGTPPSIVNNTFYANTIAISSNVNLPITNNVFSNNTTALAIASELATSITYNAFFANGTDSTTGQTGTSTVTTDPMFVSSTSGDFHLKSGSECIKFGNPIYPNIFNPKSVTTSDMGAYGGPNMDTIPFQISQPSVVATPPDAITVTWLPNNCYLITNSTGTSGSYNVYYRFGASSTTYQNPVNVISPSTTAVISGLTSTVPTPPTPSLTSSSPLNGALRLNWTKSMGATGYYVHYGIVSPAENKIDAIDTESSDNNVSYTLSGLTNGQKYFIEVSAYARAQYYVSVTAVDNTGQLPDPGSAHESAYSLETMVYLGDPSESANSNPPLEDFPEALIPYPNLSDSGQKCFIATAAYGNDSAPQVQALREFRDQYLLTNRAGRAFVRWYYEHGPVAAAYLDAHPGYKPVVRAALMPAVGAALFMTNTSLFVKAVVFLVILVIMLLTAFLFFRKRLSDIGGTQ